MAKRSRQERERAATSAAYRDDALAYTYLAVATTRAGRLEQVQAALGAPFPPVFSPNERIVAIGAYALDDYRALGDGSWSVPGYAVAGSTSLVIGSAIGHSIARSNARAQAQANAVPRWTQIDQGQLYVTTHGWHLYAQGLNSWDWPNVTSASMVAPGAVHVTGQGRTRNVSWVIRSDWAELLFGLWALARHPAHPQLASGGWLPPGWLDGAYQQGKIDPALELGP